MADSYDVPGPFTARLDCQDIKPGDEGYWKIYGATARDIRPGDLVMSGWETDGVFHHGEYEVAEMAGFTDPMMNTVRVGFITTAGTFASVGMIQPCAVVRWGTRNVLSERVR